MKQSKLFHLEDSDGGASELIHPSYDKYITLRNKYYDTNSSSTHVAKENCAKFKEVAKSLGVRKSPLTDIESDSLSEVQKENNGLDKSTKQWPIIPNGC